MSWKTVGPFLVNRSRGDRTGRWAVIRNEGDSRALAVEVSLRSGGEDCTMLLSGDVPGVLDAGEAFELKVSNLFTSGVLTLRWQDARGKAGVWHGPLSR